MPLEKKDAPQNAAPEEPSAQAEAKDKAKLVKESVTGAQDTPSGAALVSTAGIADDAARAEAYAREKAARRWGYDS